MRIDAFNQVNQVYGRNGKMKVNASTKVTSSDSLTISDFGKDLQIAKQAVAAASDIREDRVADIKKRINEGTYYVSSEDFANKFLADM